MVRRVLAVVLLGDGNELDRDQVAALVQQLEDRMLGVSADPAPGDRRGWPPHRLAVGADQLAIRFHLQLLQIGHQQPQPLVIGKDRARLAAKLLAVEQVGEGREHRRVGLRLGEPEMTVHLGRAFEQFLERLPAQRQRRREADRRPQGIAAADPLIERQDAGFVDAEIDRRLRAGGDGDDPAVGILDPRLHQPAQRRLQVEQGFGGRKRLRHGDDQAGFRVERVDRVVERLAVDVRQHTNAVAAGVATERVEQQLRPQRRAADADVQQAVHLAERPALDGVNQRAHPLMLGPGSGDVSRRPLPALRDMRRRPAFARIDNGAGEQGLSGCRELPGFGKPAESLHQTLVKVSLRPVEMQAGDVDRQALGALRIGREQGAQRRDFMRVDRAPVVAALGLRTHRRPLTACLCKCHPA